MVGEITGEGLVALVGVTHEDGPEQVATIARKIAEALRVTLTAPGDPQKVLVVPRSAVVRHQGGTFVYVQVEHGFERRLVTLGTALPGGIVVQEGVAPTDKIVDVKSFLASLPEPNASGADAFGVAAMGLTEIDRAGTRLGAVILITDGLPTAHFEGSQLFLLYPPHRRTEEGEDRCEPPLRIGGETADVSSRHAGHPIGQRREPDRGVARQIAHEAEHEPGDRTGVRAAAHTCGDDEGEHELQSHVEQRMVAEHDALDGEREDAHRTETHQRTEQHVAHVSVRSPASSGGTAPRRGSSVDAGSRWARPRRWPCCCRSAARSM